MTLKDLKMYYIKLCKMTSIIDSILKDPSLMGDYIRQCVLVPDVQTDETMEHYKKIHNAFMDFICNPMATSDDIEFIIDLFDEDERKRFEVIITREKQLKLMLY